MALDREDERRATRRPFEMAVLGDSIPWGSGLAEEDKFWALSELDDRFPNARVVVTGYFPIVSAQSWVIRALAPVPSIQRRLIELSSA